MTRTGYRLVAATMGLSFAHHIDHVVRGGQATGWPLTGSVNAYTSPLAGTVAVAALVAFVATLVFTTAYEARLGRRKS